MKLNNARKAPNRSRVPDKKSVTLRSNTTPLASPSRLSQKDGAKLDMAQLVSDFSCDDDITS